MRKANLLFVLLLAGCVSRPSQPVKTPVPPSIAPAKAKSARVLKPWVQPPPRVFTISWDGCPGTKSLNTNEFYRVYRVDGIDPDHFNPVIHTQTVFRSVSIVCTGAPGILHYFLLTKAHVDGSESTYGIKGCPD